MTKVKQSSVIQENKSIAFEYCPVTYVMEKIGGYWKPIILFHLLSGTKRYSEIKKAMPHITEKVLIQHLKQLEADKLVLRKSMPVVPPHVTYTLTTSGLTLRPVLYAMANWAVEDGRKRKKPLFKSLEDFPKLK